MTPANAVHTNLINGIWCDGDARPNINPSNTQDIVGHYVQATAQQTGQAIAAAENGGAKVGHGSGGMSLLRAV